MASPDDPGSGTCACTAKGKPESRPPRPMRRLRSAIPVRSGAPLRPSRILEIFAAFEGLGFALALARPEQLGMLGRENKFLKEPDSTRR